MMSELEWMDIFGDNLKSLLEEQWMSQQELADATGISKSTISRYINKQCMPSVAALVNIAYALNCEIDDILYFGDRLELRPSRR